MTEPPTVFFRLYADIENADGPELSDSFLAILSDLEAAVEAAEAMAIAEN